MSGQTVPGRARAGTRREAALVVARRRHHIVARLGATGRLVRALAWVVVAIGLSAAVVALVVVVAITAAIGVLSAELPDPTRLGPLASMIAQLPPG